MAPLWTFLATSVVFTVYFTSSALPSQMHVQFTTVSAAPAFLPSTAPLASPSAPSLSPDITPLFPTPGGMVPSPAESSLPTIPSSPSPPNPDDILAPGPEVTLSPTGSMPDSSSVSIGPLNFAAFLSLLMFCLAQLAWM